MWSGFGTSSCRPFRSAPDSTSAVALIDREHREGAPADGPPAEARSPVPQALLVIAEQLTEPVPGAGRIQFPRLISGLVAVAAGR